MCGITGIYSFKASDEQLIQPLGVATRMLRHRGPDNTTVKQIDNRVALGHTRLAVIDTTDAAHQPLRTKHAWISYNGEIYNYRGLAKKYLQNQQLDTHSDTEVLLRLLEKKDTSILGELNGCFAFAYYHEKSKRFFLARDRFGIKPLYYYQTDSCLFFSSELESLCTFLDQKEIDLASLKELMQLTYIPEPDSILQDIKKLPAGHVLEIEGHHVQLSKWYKPITNAVEDQQKSLRKAVKEAVERRLIADVPLGAFLSGGIDSTIIAGIAAKSCANFQTFSIGYADDPYYDETPYAEAAASFHGTAHTTFKLTREDLAESALQILDNLSEPFADSSAIALNALCKRTASEVTAILSGDGADELFAGYNKHLATWKAQHNNIQNKVIQSIAPALPTIGTGRDSSWSNLVRKIQRYAQGVELSPRERYWAWASFIPEEEVESLLLNEDQQYIPRKNSLLDNLEEQDLNSMLITDQEMVLKGDMLRKVDLASMLNGLEVRVPFLDHHVVELANSIPFNRKITDKGERKWILKETFKELLPAEIINRDKRGFEVPLTEIIRGPLYQRIFNKLLLPEKIKNQGLFHSEKIETLNDQLHSKSPGSSPHEIWTLACFQSFIDRINLYA